MTDQQPDPNSPKWAQPPTAPGGWVTPPLAPRPPKKHRGLKITGGIVGAIVVISVISSIAGGGKKNDDKPAAAPAATASATQADTDSQPAAEPATKAAAAPKKTKAKPKPPPDTVEYIVTGSRAEVTYGPAGSSLSGHSPMTVKKPLGHPTFYSVTAQLSGSGKVTCKIEIKGKVISQATATGSYNLAMCEVMQDPMGDGWIDANSS
jgi:hypothetical protein